MGKSPLVSLISSQKIGFQQKSKSDSAASNGDQVK
jgi:hypothetical protein